jgi:hypothetical protein
MKIALLFLLIFSFLGAGHLSIGQACGDLKACVFSSDAQPHPQQSESPDHSADHCHCFTHCNHNAVALITFSIEVAGFVSEGNFASYLFSYNSTYKEAPFRPPVSLV